MSSPESNQKRVVVMGGFGFIGSEVCRALVSAGYPVRVFQKESSQPSRLGGIVKQMEVVRGDQCSPDSVIEALKDAHTVVHLIHTTVPGSSMSRPGFDLQSNVVALTGWLSLLGQTSVKRVIYVSSGGAVYGVAKTLPIREDHELNPICAYGITKMACEKFVAMYCKLAGVDYRILRPSNAYGEHQPTNRGQGVVGVLNDRIAKGEPLEIWGSGRARRDYIHVHDIATAVTAAVDYSGDERIFNVSTGVGSSVLDLIDAFRKRVPDLPPAKHLPDRGFDVPDNVLDNSLLRRELNWKPVISLQEGIDRVVRARQG
jgi:UDP-glucose 4-epimerase